MTTSECAEHDALVYRIKIAMMNMPPEDLTIEELRAIETVIRGAIDRASRPVGNVINFAARRVAVSRVMRRKLGLTRRNDSVRVRRYPPPVLSQRSLRLVTTSGHPQTADMHDRETLDSELRLIALVRRSIREQGGQPSCRQADEPLDERLAHRDLPRVPSITSAGLRDISGPLPSPGRAGMSISALCGPVSHQHRASGSKNAPSVSRLTSVRNVCEFEA